MGTDSSYTLYAVWEANENTLVFDGNSATGGIMENMTIKSNFKANLTVNAFVRAGYHFVGWSTTQGGEVEYTDGAQYKMGLLPNYTLYAIWEANDNNIVFDPNGATSGSTAGLSAKTGESVTLTKNGFIRDGYTFTGWATTSYGIVKYVDGDEYTMGTEASYTLYAVWEANVYTITYEKNGGTGELKETFTIEDLPLTLSCLDDKTNYVFNCWYRESDFSGEPVLKITEIGNITLYAEYIECTDGLVLKGSNGVYTVTDYTGTATEVVIPRLYKGKKITSIGNRAFYGCTSLTSVTIPDSVTSIGNYAFRNCTSLTSVTIGDSVTSIGERAFCDCTGLTSITIPEGVTSIGDWAFYNCTRLIIYCEATSKPSGWDSYWNSSKRPVVWDCNNNEVADDGCIYTIIDGIRYALKDGEATVVRQPSNITTAYIPASITYKEQVYAVTSIGKYAFDNCTSITSITIPESVTSIGERAFYNCTRLKSITIPEGVTSIGDYVFYNCTSLTSITIPDSVTSIGDSAFEYCTSLTSVTIGNGVTSIGKYAFDNCTSITSITIPESVTSIGERAFWRCTSLTSITIPDSVTSIGYGAFRDCTSLTIYCEATSKPSGWDSNWNDSNCPVVWGKAINQ